MSTLLERIEWLIENKAGGNMREFGRMAHANGNHVGVLIHKLRRNPLTTVRVNTLVSWATHLGVSINWLANGAGEPFAENDNVSLKPDLGHRIDWILADLNVSAEALSKMAGLSPRHVSKIRNGEIDGPGRYTLGAIARAANVSLPWLMLGEGEPRVAVAQHDEASSEGSIAAAMESADSAPTGDGFSGRISWILDSLRRPDGSRWNANRLATVAGISVSHITHILTGRIATPRPETISKIAAAAGVSESWLAFGKGEPVDSYSSPTTVLGQLHHWPRLKAAAAALDPAIPGWVFELLSERTPMSTTPSPAEVIDLARLALRYVSPP